MGAQGPFRIARYSPVSWQQCHETGEYIPVLRLEGPPLVVSRDSLYKKQLKYTCSPLYISGIGVLVRRYIEEYQYMHFTKRKLKNKVFNIFEKNQK